jgi:hypothetical protein
MPTKLRKVEGNQHEGLIRKLIGIPSKPKEIYSVWNLSSHPWVWLHTEKTWGKAFDFACNYADRYGITVGIKRELVDEKDRIIDSELIRVIKPGSYGSLPRL